MSQPSTISNPPPSGRAVHARDHGNVEGGAERDATEAAGTGLGPILEPGRCVLTGVFHVGAHRERFLARAGQDDDARIRLVLELAPNLLEHGLGARVDRGQHVGAVDGDAGDVLMKLVGDAHGKTPSSRSFWTASAS